MTTAYGIFYHDHAHAPGAASKLPRFRGHPRARGGSRPTGTARRGPELVTFETPGGPGVVHRYRQQRGNVWSRSALRLASAAAELGWQLVSLSSDALALTTEHRDGHSYVDFHARGPEGNLDPTQSVQLPEAPATMGAARDRVVVGLSRPAADGGSLVLIERREASWRLRGTVTLPPMGPPSVGSMAVTSEHAAVWRGQLWLVDLATGTVTHRLVLPREHGAERPWPGAVLASCGGSVLAAAGPSLVLFDLTSIGR